MFLPPSTDSYCCVYEPSELIPKYTSIAVIIWELTGDMVDIGNGFIFTPLVDAANMKIDDPGFDCSVLRDPGVKYTKYAPD